jgi:predicted nucleic acid-binding protein
MVSVVTDSSALILLARCTLLEIACEMFEISAPSAVVSKVASATMVKKYPDGALISGLISKGAIRVQDPGATKTHLSMSLHHGEKQALLLARNMEGSIFATDDGKAIRAARFLRVPFIITPKLVVELFRLQKISFKKGRDSLEKLSKIGRYSPEIIADALVSLMEEKNGKTNNHKNT